MTMAIIAGAGLALTAAGMYSANKTAGYAAGAAIATSKGQLEVIKAETARSNAESGLQNHLNALNNSRKMKRMGKNLAAAQDAMFRMKDNRSANKLEQGIQQAEALGAMQAQLGFQGTGGASKDALEGSLRLRNARQDEDTKRNNRVLGYDSARQAAGLVSESMADLDMTVHAGTVSAAQLSPAVTGGTNWAAAIGGSNILEGIGKLANAWGAKGPSQSTVSLSSNGGWGLTPPANWGASTSFANLTLR